MNDYDDELIIKKNYDKTYKKWWWSIYTNISIGIKIIIMLVWLVEI